MMPDAYESGGVDRVAGMPVVKVRLYLEHGGIDADIFLAESRFQDRLDEMYLRQWAQELGVLDDLQRVLDDVSSS